jgi:CRP/FNR family transcriptional regulator, cyclic AMP receptor protein
MYLRNVQEKMNSKAFYLKKFSITTNLNDTEVAYLCSYFTQKEAKRNRIIYSKHGDNQLFILVSGSVKIAEMTTNGDEIIREIISAGDIFGDVMPNDARSKCEYAEIISERAIYYCIDCVQLKQLLQSSHALTMNYMNKISDRLRRLEERYLNMFTKDIRSRLLYYFKEWARSEGFVSGSKITIKNHLTHGEIANLISTSRQTVTCILNEWKKSGAIRYNRKTIEFSHLDKW